MTRTSTEQAVVVKLGSLKLLERRSDSLDFSSTRDFTVFRASAGVPVGPVKIEVSGRVGGGFQLGVKLRGSPLTLSLEATPYIRGWLQGSAGVGLNLVFVGAGIEAILDLLDTSVKLAVSTRLTDLGGAIAGRAWIEGAAARLRLAVYAWVGIDLWLFEIKKKFTSTLASWTFGAFSKTFFSV